MSDIHRDRQDKNSQMVGRRFIELSYHAFQREIPVFTDFLNLNEQNTLHTLPKDSLYSSYLSFGGYESAERQMIAFIPDALYLRYGKNILTPEEVGFPFQVLKILPLNRRYAENLTHRDYLGALLNLGIDRCKTGDIVFSEDAAFVFVQNDIAAYIRDSLTRVRHTSVSVSSVPSQELNYSPEYEKIKGTVASVRLDSLLAVAFSSSRSRLSGLIEGGNVYVNGKLVTGNGYRPDEGDIISVRGMGKFRFGGAGEKTKKQRIGVTLYKYK